MRSHANQFSTFQIVPSISRLTDYWPEAFPLGRSTESTSARSASPSRTAVAINEILFRIGTFLTSGLL